VAWCGLAGVGTLGSVGVVFTSFFVTLSPSTVVIWITAYGSQETNAEARRLGVYRCLDKPL
jgi:DNA-binding NtrC family response regulator